MLVGEKKKRQWKGHYLIMSKEYKEFRIVFGDYYTEWIPIEKEEIIDVTLFVNYDNFHFEYR